MIDLSEQLLSLVDATALIPPGRGAARCHISTIWRWILRGVKDRSGATVKLEALRLGGRWMTSREALERFSNKLTPDLGGCQTGHPRTPSARRKGAERAARELAKAGI